jgi:hypothetical protein
MCRGRVAVAGAVAVLVMMGVVVVEIVFRRRQRPCGRASSGRPVGGAGLGGQAGSSGLRRSSRETRRRRLRLRVWWCWCCGSGGGGGVGDTCRTVTGAKSCSCSTKPEPVGCSCCQCWLKLTRRGPLINLGLPARFAAPGSLPLLPHTQLDRFSRGCSCCSPTTISSNSTLHPTISHSSEHSYSSNCQWCCPF